MTDPSDDPAMHEAILEAQQALLECSLPAAFSAYDTAQGEGISQPVVFVLDCEDEVGGDIARSLLGDEAVADAIEQRKLQSKTDEEEGTETTVFTYAFSIDQCRAEVPKVFPYLAPVFEEELPKDGFLAIAVTGGGASALTVPFAARESSQ
jgi:hypothetical protein